MLYVCLMQQWHEQRLMLINSETKQKNLKASVQQSMRVTT